MFYHSDSEGLSLGFDPLGTMAAPTPATGRVSPGTTHPRPWAPSLQGAWPFAAPSTASGLGGPWRRVGSRDSHGWGTLQKCDGGPQVSWGWGADSASPRPWLMLGTCSLGRAASSLVPPWAAAWQWLLEVCRIVVSSTHSLRQSPSWHPQGLRGHLLQPEAGTTSSRPRHPHPCSGPTTHTAAGAERPECWLPSRQGPSPASPALTPASACTPPRLGSSLPPCQEQAWVEP